jgi:hypothetical protein
MEEHTRYTVSKPQGVFPIECIMSGSLGRENQQAYALQILNR